MSAGSKIEWTDNTWNVVTGCTKVSPACDHCYIDRTPPFRMEHRKFDSDGPGSTTGIRLHPERLDWPLTRWKNKPAKIFTCSLSDIFHDEVPDDFLADVFGVMAHARQHTFQVLTKRHARMRSLLSSPKFREAVADRILRDDAHARARWAATNWPLPNVWLGVTVENQQWADTRIPMLLDTPAAVRFISAEPLLGPIELRAAWTRGKRNPDRPVRAMDILGIGKPAWIDTDAGIDWVITGGETGPGARPSHPGWFRSLRDECAAAGVAFFMKQWGDWTSTVRPDIDSWYAREPDTWVCRTDGRVADEPTALADGGSWAGTWRVGKKNAGRLLDGRTYDEFPAGPRKRVTARDLLGINKDVAE